MNSDSQIAYPGELYISELWILIYTSTSSRCADSWLMINRNTNQFRIFFPQQR